MSKFSDNVDKLAKLKASVSEVEMALNADIQIITNLVSKLARIHASEIVYYNSTSFVNRTINNHLISGYFDSFKLHEGDVYSFGGTYNGSRGYCETEYINIPAKWFDLVGDEEALSKEIVALYNSKLTIQQEQAKALEIRQREERRRKFEALKKEFEE